MSTLEIALTACGAIAFVCWLVSVLTREYSWVDRLWSIVPIGYAAFFAYASGFAPRATLMAALVTAWGARLTFNFARKGGYAEGGEDYRWAELRTRMSPLAFHVFNVFFIAGFQNALLLAITLPAWRVTTLPTTPLGALDVLAAALFATLLVSETIADEQQWRFQNEKKARRARGEAITEPFVTTGLFRFSRHPNFFCEISLWWVFCLFAIAAGGSWADPSFLGAVVLTGLFQGSTNFTEELSLRKYPSYAEYQQTTSRLIPWFPRPRSGPPSSGRGASPGAP